MSEVAPETSAPAEATPVEQQQPSNAAVKETVVEKVEEEVVDIFEAAKRLVGLVEQHRTIGDAEVGAAVADVRSVVGPAEVEVPEPVVLNPEPAKAEAEAPAEAPAQA